MAYTTIDNPFKYFNTKLYTGNGSTQALTGVGFQPDFTWLKNRSTSQDSKLYDSVRGANKLVEACKEKISNRLDKLTLVGSVIYK